MIGDKAWHDFIQENIKEVTRIAGKRGSHISPTLLVGVLQELEAHITVLERQRDEYAKLVSVLLEKDKEEK